MQSRRERLHPIRAGQELPLGPQGFDLAVAASCPAASRPAILACVGLPHGVVGILTTPKGGGSFERGCTCKPNWPPPFPAGCPAPFAGPHRPNPMERHWLRSPVGGPAPLHGELQGSRHARHCAPMKCLQSSHHFYHLFSFSRSHSSAALESFSSSCRFRIENAGSTIMASRIQQLVLAIFLGPFLIRSEVMLRILSLACYLLCPKRFA